MLIVSSSDKINDSFSRILDRAVFSPLKFVSDAGKARRELLEHSYDIIIINSPLPDEFGTKLAVDASVSCGAGILLLTKSDVFDEISEEVAGYGVLAVSKPTSSGFLSQVICLLCGTRERLRNMERRTATLEEKMDEIRIVNHAKWVLIDSREMTEKEAHRYIEKAAMDRCVSKRVIAEEIIDSYSSGDKTDSDKKTSPHN